MSQIDCIYVACCSKDAWLARTCVASIRYWYPSVPIYLVKDRSRGDFFTKDIEECWKVDVLQRPCDRLGYFGKIDVLFHEVSRRFLLLDSDTVLVGRVLDHLNMAPGQFVVSADWVKDYQTDWMRANYFDVEKLQQLDPTFIYPGYVFNSGQFVASTGVLSRAQFDPWIDWTDPPRLKRPDLFILGDQGVLNYVLAKASQQGLATTDACDFKRNPRDSEFQTFDMNSIVERVGEPFVVHWCGEKGFSVDHFSRAEILRFFSNQYWAATPRGRWRAMLQKEWESIKFNALRTSRLIYAATIRKRSRRKG